MSQTSLYMLPCKELQNWTALSLTVIAVCVQLSHCFMCPSSKLLWLYFSWKQLLVPCTTIVYCNKVSVPLPYMIMVIQLYLTIYTSLYIHSCTSIDIQICMLSSHFRLRWHPLTVSSSSSSV